MIIGSCPFYIHQLFDHGFLLQVMLLANKERHRSSVSSIISLKYQLMSVSIVSAMLVLCCHGNCVVFTVTYDLKLPEYAHRRCSLEGKVCPAQLYKQLLDKTAVFTVGADCSNTRVRQLLMCQYEASRCNLVTTVGLQHHKDSMLMEF